MANIELDKLEYLNIQILKTEVSNILKSPLQKGDSFQLDYKIKTTHLYNLEKQLIRVIIDVEIIVLKDGTELDAGAKFEIDNYFRYEKLKDFAQSEKDRVLIEFQFADLIKGLAYSTARGIIFSKLAGTYLEGNLLPIKMSTDI